MALWMKSDDLGQRLAAYSYMGGSEEPQATELLIEATQEEADYWALELALGCLTKNSIPSMPGVIESLIDGPDPLKALIAIIHASENEIAVSKTMLESLYLRQEWFLKLAVAAYETRLGHSPPPDVVKSIEVMMLEHEFTDFQKVSHGVFGLRLLSEKKLALETLDEIRMGGPGRA